MRSTPLIFVDPDRTAAQLHRHLVPDGDCIVFTGYTFNGYGRIGVKLVDVGWQVKQAHVVAWTLANGPVPAGLVLDHLRDRCTSRACCNTAHLEVVTQAENAKRSHFLKPEVCVTCGSDDWYIQSPTVRRCRPCRQSYQRQWRAARA